MIRHDLAGALASPRRSGTCTIFVGRVGRSGGHEYPGRMEYRSDAELRRLAGQLAGLPVTLGHPSGLLGNGARGHVVGKVLTRWIEGDHAVAEIKIDDREALNAIQAGRNELSLGYSVETDGAGNHSDTKLDHLAIVYRARCGPSCRLRTDCGGDCDCNCAGNPAPTMQADSSAGGTMTQAELEKAMMSGIADARSFDPALADHLHQHYLDGLELHRQTQLRNQVAWKYHETQPPPGWVDTVGRGWPAARERLIKEDMVALDRKDRADAAEKPKPRYLGGHSGVIGGGR